MSFEPIESNEIEATPHLSPDSLVDALCAAMAEGDRALEAHYLVTIETLENWPDVLADAERLYAQALGVESLTDEQKKQALLNHILGEEE